MPNSTEIVDTFGTGPTPRTKSSEPIDLPMCRLLSSYDVLNHIIHESKLSGCNGYEVEQAIDLLSEFNSDDVVLFDRHYASYDFIARLSSQGGQFVIRCPNSTFREGQRVFSGGSWTKMATLTVPGGRKKVLKQQGLPLSVTVRFVRVKLDNGETEVLVTSLDDKALKSADFHYLYGLRWGVETLFDILKNRLSLENFTGYSVESVKQDIFSSLFITNMETVLTEDVNAQLKQASNDCQYVKKVNKVISIERQLSLPCSDN